MFNAYIQAYAENFILLKEMPKHDWHISHALKRKHLQGNMYFDQFSQIMIVIVDKVEMPLKEPGNLNVYSNKKTVYGNNHLEQRHISILEYYGLLV